MTSPLMQMTELVIALDESREEARNLQARLAELSGPFIYYPFRGYEEPYAELLRRRAALVKLFELSEYPADWRREERRWEREFARQERLVAEDRAIRRAIAGEVVEDQASTPKRSRAVHEQYQGEFDA